MKLNRYIVNACFGTQLIGRVIMYPILPICFLALVLPIFEPALIYLAISFFAFCFIALPVYILGMLQKCGFCGKRVLILPKGLRRPEFVKSQGFWYSNFGELLDIIKLGDLPCHHCGKVNKLK